MKSSNPIVFEAREQHPQPHSLGRQNKSTECEHHTGQTVVTHQHCKSACSLPLSCPPKWVLALSELVSEIRFFYYRQQIKLLLLCFWRCFFAARGKGISLFYEVKCKKVFVGLLILVQHILESFTCASTERLSFQNKSSNTLCTWCYEKQLKITYSSLENGGCYSLVTEKVTRCSCEGLFASQNWELLLWLPLKHKATKCFPEKFRWKRLLTNCLCHHSREELPLAGNISEIFIVFWKFHFISNLFTVKHSES